MVPERQQKSRQYNHKEINLSQVYSSKVETDNIGNKYA